MFLTRGKHLTGSVNALQTIPGEISLGPEDSMVASGCQNLTID